MASTDEIQPVIKPMLIGDVESNRPNSEAVNSKIGGNINALLRNAFFDIKFNFSGYISNNAFDMGVGGIEVIENNCEITRYFLSLHRTGSSGTTDLNVAIYDSAGSFVTNLFGSGANALSVTGSNGINTVIGKNGVDTATPTNILTNTAGHTVFTGTPNITTLLAGYVLIPFVNSGAVDALNANLSLRLKAV